MESSRRNYDRDKIMGKTYNKSKDFKNSYYKLGGKHYEFS